MAPRKLVLAVDIGGTKVESALVAADASVIASSRHRSPTGHDVSRDGFEKAIRSVIASTMAEPIGSDSIIAAGIGSAGPVDAGLGEISPLNMPGCWDFPVARIVRDASGLSDVTLRLDGLCIALAEHWVGALRDYHNAVGMVVSTGIGGGILSDGRLLGGKSGNAGHIGQVRVSTPETDGPDFDSTLEGTASGPHIVRWAQQQGWKGATGEDLGVSYAAGDPIAIAAVRRCGETLGFALSTVAALTDLEAVAIGGGFSRVTPDLFDFARDAFAKRATLRTMKGIEILPSGLSDEGPLIGAAGLIHRADLLPETA